MEQLMSKQNVIGRISENCILTRRIWYDSQEATCGIVLEYPTVAVSICNEYFSSTCNCNSCRHAQVSDTWSRLKTMAESQSGFQFTWLKLKTNIHFIKWHFHFTIQIAAVGGVELSTFRTRSHLTNRINLSSLLKRFHLRLFDEGLLEISEIAFFLWKLIWKK